VRFHVALPDSASAFVLCFRPNVDRVHGIPSPPAGSHGKNSGFSLHDELALMVEGGLTPLEALRTATLNPARFLGKLDDLGTIEKGKLADLVILDANPLDDIHDTTKINAVIAQGKLLERTDLDRLMREAEEMAKAPERPEPQ
jgi:adenine deaminase